MRTNPISDLLAFLTGPFYSEPDWLHYAYWVVALASIAIAVAAWRVRNPEHSPIVDLWRFAVRFVIGSFWWQQSLWKFPTDTGGLRYWTEQEVQHSAFSIQAALIKTLILPIFEPFAYGVYALEVLIAVTLLLGLGVRISATFGALLIGNLFFGLYQAPQEWPWSYAFLLILMIAMAVEDYGQNLGLEALLARRRYPIHGSEGRPAI